MIINFTPRRATCDDQSLDSGRDRTSAMVVTMSSHRTASWASPLNPGTPEYEEIVQQAIERAEKRGW
jgi:hypothetical protein